MPIDTIIEWLTNPFTHVSLNLAHGGPRFAIVLPGIGFTLSLLAVIAAALQFVQVRMTSPRGNAGDDPTAATTQTMTYLFPVMTIVWGGIFPSGLVLYWGRLHRLPHRSAVPDHGVGQSLPALRVAAPLGSEP